MIHYNSSIAVSHMITGETLNLSLCVSDRLTIGIVLKERLPEAKEANIVAGAISRINGWCSGFIVLVIPVIESESNCYRKTLLAVI